MPAKLYDVIPGDLHDLVGFLENILQASTEYSIIGSQLDGTIQLWNEGARRLYGYEPEEVIGKADISLLHSPDDRACGQPQQILDQTIHQTLSY
jgi:PAS domain S-box-containing protein